jgi:exo-1,4-beta-D-glucosaminidase
VTRFALITAIAMAACACTATQSHSMTSRIELADGWHIAPAADIDAEGAAVSSAGFDANAWTPASVPSTPMAALVQSGAIAEPYFDRRLERVDPAMFDGPWWYRTRFNLDETVEAGARLVFEGINYRADVWLNGRQIAGRDDIAGAFRMFDLEVSDQLIQGENTLAVLVYPPQPGDPTIGFVDWNPLPPDRNMGLWRPVHLQLTRGVSLDTVFVRSEFDTGNPAEAFVTISATLHNHTDREIEAVVRARLADGTRIEDRHVLAAREEKDIELAPARFPGLRIENPRLWWPNGLGEPNLYTLEMHVSADGRPSDTEHVTFGIRKVDDYINDQGHRGYTINGRKLLLRGGGWVDDMLLMEDPQKIEDQLRYVRHMNLNTIRLEGFWGSSRTLYELADRYGIMVMVGWSCQWEWENYLGAPVDDFGGIDTPAEIELVSRSLADQVRWLRNHPSIVVWVLASDKLPRTALEQSYRDELAQTDDTRPALTSCAVGVSEVSGPTGVKMNGPYDWVPPNYWYLDTERGGAYGFNTETGPGPQPPPAASIRRMLPEDHWWPPDDMWDYHSGRNEFNTIDRYEEALRQRYGEPASLDEFARLAQVANYEAMRAMFESFAIRRPATTGLIQWMLNSAWPEFYWQLYDYFLVPNGAFYGARDGSRAINIAYDYADDGIYIVNETQAPLDEATARVRILDVNSRVLFDETVTLDVGADSVQRVLALPPVEAPPGKAYFVDLRLAADDASLARSFYWLSARPDVPDWEASTWFVTPVARYADLTAVSQLPPATLEVEHEIRSTGDGHAVDVRLHNPGDTLAFFVEVSVAGSGSGRLAAPVFWSDNYVSLLPGETVRLTGTIPSHALAGEAPALRVSGVNVTAE